MTEPKSYQQMKVDDLLGIAEMVGGIDIEPGAKKAEIIVALEEAGMPFSNYKKLFLQQPEDEVETPQPITKKFEGKTVVMKMERQNPTYQIQGFTFTKRHPYIPMSEADAQSIFDAVGPNSGFRLATPREVEEFYS